MKIGYISTNNKGIAKDTLIKTLIKLGMQYVEMEDEVLIESDYLIMFIEKEEVYNNLNLINILDKPYSFKNFTLDIEEPSLGIDSFPKFKKNDYKSESRRIKSKIKTKIDYRRKY